MIKDNCCRSLFFAAFIILYCAVFFDCRGQITFNVSQPRLSMADDSLLIKYDIVSINPKDKFYIWLEITDSTGMEIHANALNGDIGDSIEAGSNRQIIWNLTADNISINSTVNFEIIAEKIITPDLITKEKETSEIHTEPDKKELSRDKQTIKESSEKTAASYTPVKTGKLLFQSAIFPGWGLTSLSHGKPYWIIGIAGMGCLGSSVYFNHRAHSNYDEYLESSKDNISGYYDDAISQAKLSKAFAWSAAVIWVADLSLVYMQANRLNKSMRKLSRSRDLSISTSIDIYGDTPLFTLQFNF